jgi:hypothetical protein
MKITSLIPGLLVFLCHSAGFESGAQDHIKRIDAVKMPVESASTGDFVPQGWVIEEE